MAVYMRTELLGKFSNKISIKTILGYYIYFKHTNLIKLFGDFQMGSIWLQIWSKTTKEKLELRAQKN